MNKEELILAIGTESSQKLGYLEGVLSELGIKAELKPFKAASGVSDQPITSGETLIGATNRAKAALYEFPESNYGIGIEVGYDLNSDDLYEMFCWSVAINQQGEIAKARSHSFLLPEFHQSVLKDGRYLGEYVREYFNVSPDPVTQYVAEALRSRKLFIAESLRYALIYALHGEFYSKDI